MANVSIIVPVYKVEKYLSRCIDSILEQTYQDFELILVDDGSPDQCGAMCDDYGKRDKRIVVLHRQNGGLSAARNTGIDWVFANSDSEWLTFIDSDDWVHPQYLERLLYAAKQSHTHVSVCCQKRATEYNGEEMELLKGRIQVEEMTAEDLLVNHEWNFNYAWGKLYRRKYFEKIRYPDGKNFEDIFTTYKVLFAEKTVAFFPDKLYFYFVNNEGISRSPWTPKELVVFDGMRQQLLFYENNGYSRALEKEKQLYVNHFAYQLERIRENRDDLASNRVYLRQLRKEMLRIIRQDPSRFGYRKMPQCYDAAYPALMRIYHKLGNWARRALRGWK